MKARRSPWNLSETQPRLFMKTSISKQMMAETVLGAAVGAALAGPVGAVVGGLVGRQAAMNLSHDDELARQQNEHAADDPLIHAQLKRILVPLDFSPASLRALRFAREWASRFGSEICLLHVVEANYPIAEYGAVPYVPPSSQSADLHAQAREELQKIAGRELGELREGSVFIREGAPYDQIVSAARELSADIIIISTHGRTGLSHLIMGSTAERVVRFAGCPVLTLRRAH